MKLMLMLLIAASISTFTSCNKEEDPKNPTEIVSTMERINDGTTFVQASYSDGTRLYFELLSDNTAAVTSVEAYYNGTTPPVNYCPKNAVIPSEISHNGKTYTVVGIQPRAFFLCYNLTTIKLPNTVSYIGSEAFCGPHLESFDFHEGITQIGDGVFSGCDFTSIQLNEAITYIPKNAFMQCEYLTSVTLPRVDTIREDGFSLCEKLTSIELPATTKALYSGAFANCTSLKTVTCQAINPPALVVPFYNHYTSTNVFGGCPIEEIRVPEGSVEAYRTAEMWSLYADKIIGITSKH